jgi:ribosomal protein S24E
MELKIISKKEDPLLSRTVVEAEIIFEKATPSRAEIKGSLAKSLGKDEKLIVVKGIYTSYGLKKAKNMCYIYENEESLKKIEAETKKKSKKKEAKEGEEKKAEEKPQEQVKKEEPKQEVKQEEKPKAKAEAKQEPKDQKEAKGKGK